MAPAPGQVIKATGEWGNHPQYGEQFTIQHYTTMVSATAAGIEKYPGSGLIKGIGPVNGASCSIHRKISTEDWTQKQSE